MCDGKGSSGITKVFDKGHSVPSVVAKQEARAEKEPIYSRTPQGCEEVCHTSEAEEVATSHFTSPKGLFSVELPDEGRHSVHDTSEQMLYEFVNEKSYSSTVSGGTQKTAENFVSTIKSAGVAPKVEERKVEFVLSRKEGPEGWKTQWNNVETEHQSEKATSHKGKVANGRPVFKREGEISPRQQLVHSKGKKKGPCYNCEEVGHYAKQCPHKENKWKEQNHEDLQLPLTPTQKKETADTKIAGQETLERCEEIYGNPVEQRAYRQKVEWIRRYAPEFRYLFEGRLSNALRRLIQKRKNAATADREKIPETSQEMDNLANNSDNDETRGRSRHASLSPSRNQADDDEARVKSCDTSQPAPTSSPKRPIVSDVGHMESSQVTNSSSSRQQQNDTHSGDETRNGTARPTHACNPPAYLGDYVRKVNDAPKSWETVPNPVNPPGTKLNPLGTAGSDFLSWQPERSKIQTARLADFCAYLWPENLDCTFYHDNMLTCEYGRTDRMTRDDKQQTDRSSNRFYQIRSCDNTDYCACVDHELFCCLFCRNMDQKSAEAVKCPLCI